MVHSEIFLSERQPWENHYFFFIMKMWAQVTLISGEKSDTSTIAGKSQRSMFLMTYKVMI
jgi:hypothetical protein